VYKTANVFAVCSSVTPIIVCVMFSFAHDYLETDVCLTGSLVLSSVLVPLSFHSHTRLRVAQLKKNWRQFSRA